MLLTVNNCRIQGFPALPADQWLRRADRTKEPNLRMAAPDNQRCARAHQELDL
jgi:hypothetical protein